MDEGSGIIQTERWLRNRLDLDDARKKFAESESLNLKPIENVWAFMKTQLRSIKREFPELESAVYDILNKIPSEMVFNLYESMLTRIQKCISNTGFSTKY